MPGAPKVLTCVAILFAISLHHSVIGAAPDEKRSISIDWNADDYQTVLWKLFHGFDRVQKSTWKDSYIHSFGWKLKTASLKGGSTNTRILSMPGKIASLPIPHKLQFNAFSTKEDRMISLDPIIEIDFEKPVPLSDLQERMKGKDVLARLLRLPRVAAAAGSTDGIVEIELEFGALHKSVSDYNQDYCNGFTATITFRDISKRDAGKSNVFASISTCADGSKAYELSYIIG